MTALSVHEDTVKRFPAFLEAGEALQTPAQLTQAKGIHKLQEHCLGLRTGRSEVKHTEMESRKEEELFLLKAIFQLYFR